MSDQYFTSSQIARHARLTVHMVNYLCRIELLEPSLSVERRKGVERRYSFTDLVLARAVSKLLRAGVSVCSVRKALCTLKLKLDRLSVSALSGKSVTIVGNAVYLSDAGQPIVELSANGQLAFSFVLDTKKVRSRISKASPRKRKRAL